MSIVAAGIAVVGLLVSVAGIVSGSRDRKYAAAKDRELRAANASAANITREGNNIASQARGNLARWVQSVNNNKVLTSGGHSIEEAQVNYRRHQDTLNYGSFSQQIQAAEQLGTAAASRAMSGNHVVANMVGASTSLRGSIMAQQLTNRNKMMEYDHVRRVTHMQSQMIGGLDQTSIFDNIDLAKDVTIQETAGTAIPVQQLGGLLTSAKDTYKAVATLMEPPAPPATDHFAFSIKNTDTQGLSLENSFDTMGSYSLASGTPPLAPPTTPQF